LGIHGEGLFKLLRVMSQNEKAEFKTLKENLKLLGWFSDFNIEPSEFSEERKLAIKDKFLKGDLKYFDQKSSNEGFLFLLFYLALFLSKETPKFFAVENIETSLNPKLCTKLIKLLNGISKDKEKQVILTTHNPAILDGLDLNDDEQRLFVVHRNTKGHTKITRIHSKEGAAAKVKLSEAFMNGYLGGLPENF
jgi:predicted ATPase